VDLQSIVYLEPGWTLFYRKTIFQLLEETYLGLIIWRPKTTRHYICKCQKLFKKKYYRLK